ncbi:MAG: DUF6383 domain-containing protein [Parabacteroides sp.]|nr:DUF6383 domain-containing protein [Parabacteroides sp.]
MKQTSTYYLSGEYQAPKDAVAAYYPLTKANAAGITEANAATYVIWTVTAGQNEGFTLSTTMDGATYVVVNDEGTLKVVAEDDADGLGGAVEVKLNDNSELVLAIGGNELKWDDLTLITATAEVDNAIQFGQWEDAPVAETPNTPGYDLPATDENGALVFTGEEDALAPSYKAPIYFKTGDGKYLYAEIVEGNIVVKESTILPSATNALNASWRIESGRLVSVYAETLTGDVSHQKYLVYTATTSPASNRKSAPAGATASANYAVTPNTGAANIVNAKIASNALVLSTSTVASISSVSVYPSVAVANNQVSGNIYGVSGLNVVNSSLDVMNEISGYMLVKFNDGTNSGLLVVDPSNGTASVSTSTTVGDLNAYKNYLWKVDKKTVNNSGTEDIYYIFTSLATKDNKAIQWKINSTTDMKANTEYSNQGIILSVNDQEINGNGALVDGNLVTGNAAVVAFYAPFDLAKTASQLSEILNPGFDLAVEYEKDSKKVFENADAFAGTMFPIQTITAPATPSNDATIVELWNNKDGKTGKNAEKLVLEVEEISGSDVKGDFKWLTTSEIKKGIDAGKTYYRNFRFEYLYNGTDVIERVAVFAGTSGSPAGYISILENSGKYYLTTSTNINAKHPYIKLGGNNIVKVTDLLYTLWNISYADSKKNASDDNEAYKLNGILAVVNENNDDVADYVEANTVAESAPEAQWMVTSADLKANTFTLTNRENPEVTISNLQLRKRDGGKYEIYVMASSTLTTSQKNLIGGTSWGNGSNDIVYVTKSTKANNFQGYMKATEYDLRSNNYHLGQYHGVSENNNAYFVENHANSHQIGTVANSGDADKWKLHFAMKQDDNNKYTEVDTVYVVTEYATLNDDKDGFLSSGDKKVVRDTLAILPYTFQKVANREFVKFDGRKNFEFYICDENNKDNSESYYKAAQRFALKVKPNGYNFVELRETVKTATPTVSQDANNYVTAYRPGYNKVFLANSLKGGSLEQLDTYAKDVNSIMVVEPADASEYHKIAEYGEIVKLFRSENNDQVLYEKRDNKSVVEGDTLSFLNIDNTNQFDVNPAIFVDTAYVDRHDNEGVLNTTYQYLLAVNESVKEEAYCPYNDLHNSQEWRDKENGGKPCADAVENKALKGCFLMNLIDTANVYGVNHIHNNWYINEAEVGADKRAKLAFVEGIHAGDTLYLTRKGGEAVKIAMDSPEFNVAKFAFRYVNSDAKTFKIQTLFKNYLGDDKNLETAAEFAEAYANNASYTSEEGYLRWINGTVVVTKGYENGDVFEIEENYDGSATGNESIDAASTFSVVAGNGFVTVKGAEGKTVIITNVLGQTIASTIITSSEATISVPAGVVVVVVDGEGAVKAIVK